MTFKKWWVFFWGALFLVPELVAATDSKPGGTMSEWIWDVFAIRLPLPRFAKLRHFILGGMLWSLAVHFLFAWSVVPVIVFGVGVLWCIYYHHKYEL